MTLKDKSDCVVDTLSVKGGEEVVMRCVCELREIIFRIEQMKAREPYHLLDTLLEHSCYGCKL